MNFSAGVGILSGKKNKQNKILAYKFLYLVTNHNLKCLKFKVTKVN